MAAKVSIAMASYNGARFIEAQLQSLIAQQHPPYEIVICDDGSTDNTIAICTAFAATSSIPIRIERNPVNLGWRANFIKAASLCSGDLIAFCDQDDIWHQNKLSVVVKEFERDGVLMVFHNAEVVDAELRHKGTLSMQRPDSDVSPPMAFDPWISLLGLTITFRRQLLDFWPLWEYSVDKYTPGHRAAHDQWVSFLASSLGTTIYCDENLLQYRQHGNNAMGLALSQTLRDKFTHVLDFYKIVDLRLCAAASRELALSTIASMNGEFAEQAEKGSLTYREYRKLLSLQRTIYASNSLRVRIRALVQLKQLDAYRGGRWSLTRSMRYRDLLAVMGGPRALAAASSLVSS